MRECINTNNAVLALGNWLLRPQKPYRITKQLRFWQRCDGYDLYRPCNMDQMDRAYFEDVLRLARNNPHVRIMS